MTRSLWTAAIAAAVFTLYILRLDSVAGLYVDDGWYVLLAKAVAQGDGYRLISSAAVAILPAFPPGFPMLLAPVFALNPNFPDNVLWLKAVSIAAMFGVGAMSYLFLVRYRETPRPLAAVVALITVLTPAFVFLATSTVMAECAFTLGQMGMVLAVERAARIDNAVRARLTIGLAAALGVATLLIRASGLAPLLAAGIYLGLRRGWRSVLTFAAVAAVCYLPWGVYANAHRPTHADRVAHGGSIAYAYGDLLMMREGGDASSGRAAFGDLPARVVANLAHVFGRDLGALILPTAYRGADESGQEVFSLSGRTGLRAGSMGGGAAIAWVSSALSAIAIVGFAVAVRRRLTVVELMVPLTIAMVSTVSVRTFRYLLPLTPFVVFYVLSGIDIIAAAIRRTGTTQMGSAMRISALCVLCLIGADHAQYVWHARLGTARWLQDDQDVRAVTDWMNANLPREGAVTTSNPGLVHLLTGHKTVAYVDPRQNWNRWQAAGVRYAVSLHAIGRPPVDLGYRVLYESPRLHLWVLELHTLATGADRK